MTQMKSAIAFAQGHIFETLSSPLQTCFRFFIHPLPSRDFGLCYLGLTRGIRPPLDSVGFTLLYRLVLCSLLGAVSSAVEILFTQLENAAISSLIHLPFGYSLSA
jgi:hypothetical protein